MTNRNASAGGGHPDLKTTSIGPRHDAGNAEPAGVSRRQFAVLVAGAAAAGAGLVRHAPARQNAAASTQSAGSGAVQIDADFPGGNIVVERIQGHEVYLHQDLRDTEGWWFYWCFRVRGAAGQELLFHFTNKNVFAAHGPAASLDGGRSWHWLGAGVIQGDSFRFAVPEHADEVRFCLAMPYLEENLRQFLRRHEGNPHLRLAEHCVTRKGRTTERLHLGSIAEEPQYRVLLTCRHHACEMMVNWVLEGLMDMVLGPGDDGHWFCRQVEMVAIPFMDKDGVEDGDQGKNRKPHDHNRDYLGESIYPSVAALKAFAPQWSQGKLRMTLDLHCPYIRGGGNDHIFLVGQPNAAIQAQIDRFSGLLAAAASGPLPYDPKYNIPFGTSWNTAAEPRKSSRWAASIPGVALASTLEFPYATAGGKEVNIATARRFGQDLARAIRRFLETLG